MLDGHGHDRDGDGDNSESVDDSWQHELSEQDGGVGGAEETLDGIALDSPLSTDQVDELFHRRTGKDKHDDPDNCQSDEKPQVGSDVTRGQQCTTKRHDSKSE